MTYKIKIFISWVIAVLFLSSCAGLQFKYAALNYAGHVDGIYNSTHTVKIDTLNEFQFRNKIRNDFQFRFDYAQYALSQPRSFDWNNRLLGFRYNRFNRWGSFYNKCGMTGLGDTLILGMTHFGIIHGTMVIVIIITGIDITLI
jgi:hypothetical protein